MKIAIVGAGALGLYYGGLLQKSGEDLHFLLRSDYDAISKNGLKIFSCNGNFYLPKVNAYLNPSEIGVVDLVIIGLKTFANRYFNELLSPLVGDNTTILTLQNGLGNEETLAKLFGAVRIVGGVAFLCSNRGKPGEVHHLGAGRIVIGEHCQCNPKRIDELVEMFCRSGVECRGTDDLKKARWEKLVWNIPFNGLCALLQQPVNMLLDNKNSRLLVREIMLETIAAANAQQLSKSIADDFADKMLDFTETMGEYRPSMQIDRNEGRQLEIDAIFRKPLQYGGDHGVCMPRIEMLTTLLEQVTS